jgi:hypothetical protein
MGDHQLRAVSALDNALSVSDKPRSLILILLAKATNIKYIRSSEATPLFPPAGVASVDRKVYTAEVLRFKQLVPPPARQLGGSATAQKVRAGHVSALISPGRETVTHKVHNLETLGPTPSSATICPMSI